MIGIVSLALDVADQNLSAPLLAQTITLLIVAKRGIEPPKTLPLLCEWTPSTRKYKSVCKTKL